MVPVSFLPKFFRWVFTVLMVLVGIGVFGIVVALIIDPHLPPGTHFGPVHGNFAGQPAVMTLAAHGSDSDLSASLFKGTISLFVTQANGLFEELKHKGLIVALIDTIFLVVLLDLLRRLFRNVGRGESFTRQTVQLVQLVGASMIVLSIVSYWAENWFAQSVYFYLAEHATIVISGATIHLPHTHGFVMPRPGNGGSPIFFSGLLVLALSEVFRQGLALKAENDLTV